MRPALNVKKWSFSADRKSETRAIAFRMRRYGYEQDNGGDVMSSVCKQKSRLVFSFCALLVLIAAGNAIAGGPVGFAAMDGQGIHYLAGGTTGGAGGQAVTVETLSDLAYYLTQTAPYIVQVKGQIASPTPGRINVKSNKTLIGLGNDAAIINQGLNLNGVSNIIIKNLTIRDYHMMGDYDGKVNDYDAIALRNVHHVWIDRCHLSRAGDGLLDMTYASGYVTVSRTIFSYHNKASITDGRESPLHIGKYTFHHCWFNNTVQRNTASSRADLHVFNCYFLGVRSYCMNARTDTRILLEHTYFQQSKSPYYGENGGRVQVSGNILDQTTGYTIAQNHDFVPPYAYTADQAADVPAKVTTQAGPGGFHNDVGHGAIRINFLPAGRPETQGYLSDYGDVFGNRGNGYSYGWNAANTANALWRLTTSYKDDVSQVPVDQDLRRNGLITMDNGSRYWQIALPNGLYHVTLMCGDPGDPRNITPGHNVQRNNTMYIEGIVCDDPDGALLWDYDEYTSVVQVTGGRLTIAQGPGGSQAAICFAEIRPARAPVAVETVGPGLLCRYYEGQWPFLPDFETLTPLAQSAVADFDPGEIADPDNGWGCVFEGLIDIPADGWYLFITKSTGGSRLFIGTTEVVDNDGAFGLKESSGGILLTAGLHPIRLEWFDLGEDDELGVYWASDAFGKERISADRLARPWRYGDMNGDGVVNTEDLSLFTEFWLQYDCDRAGSLDRNADCLINGAEFSKFAEQWLMTP